MGQKTRDCVVAPEETPGRREDNLSLCWWLELEVVEAGDVAKSSVAS